MANSPVKKSDVPVDHKAVLALIVNSGFYRHKNLRRDIHKAFSGIGNESDWDGFTSTVWEVLFFLIESHILGAKVSVTDIPHATGLSTSTARRALRKLEKTKLAVTHTADSDKRRIITELSEAYRPVVDDFVAGYANGFSELIQLHDKQERKAAEQALERTREDLEGSEALLIQAQRLTSIGHWLWDDIEGDYISVSEENARIHGMALDEYLNDGVINYFDDRFVHPDDIDDFRAAVTHADENCIGYDSRYRIIRADGELRHIREISEPVVDGTGKLVRSIGTTQDITDYVVAEQAVMKSEQRYKMLLEQSSDLISVYLPDGTRTYVNRAFCDFAGKPQKELIRSKAGSEYSPPDVNGMKQKLKKLTIDQPTMEHEFIMKRHDGEDRTTLWIDHGLFDENNKLTEVHATGHDITDNLQRRAGDVTKKKK